MADKASFSDADLHTLYELRKAIGKIDKKELRSFHVH